MLRHHFPVRNPDREIVSRAWRQPSFATRSASNENGPATVVATISNAYPYQDERTQVRARLLRMILETNSRVDTTTDRT